MALDDGPVAAKELYEKYGFLIYRTCRRILGSDDDAKDALQAVFLKLLEQYGSIRNKERTVPWIFIAAKRHCFNMLRDNRKFADGIDPDDTAARLDEGKRLDEKDLIRLIFADQNEKVRDAVYYTYVEEFGQEEIRKITGQSPATIRRNLKRFRDGLPALRKRLGI
ncbi:MAG TPA: sigma-70 family RNA polymerase sigma factor [Chitinivibrionales bacterium]|jgi:RNA polymerase sigma-70 factor (ECF subfamily)|nr:sigma-70 family RNA polymerase sigma factor [Chitinivibrionales bacterium]